MLIPTKHMDLETCTLACAAACIEILEKKGPQQFDALLFGVQKAIGDNARFRFSSSLGFLFLLGMLEYFEDSDTFMLISRDDK